MHFQFPVAMWLGRTASFNLVFASAALLEVVGEAASPPIKFLPALWCGWHLPSDYVLF